MHHLRDEETTVTIECALLHQTAKAVLVEDEGKEIWIPKSQIVDGLPDVFGRGEIAYLEITEWIAKEKGWI